MVYTYDSFYILEESDGRIYGKECDGCNAIQYCADWLSSQSNPIPSPNYAVELQSSPVRRPIRIRLNLYSAKDVIPSPVQSYMHTPSLRTP